MTLFVVITYHPPNLCHLSNSETRPLLGKAIKLLHEVASRLGIEVLAGPLITSDHRSFTMLRAPEVDAVRTLTLETGIIQWNDVEIVPCINAERAASEMERMTPIFGREVG